MFVLAPLKSRTALVVLALAFLTCRAIPYGATGQQIDKNPLRIGTSVSLAADAKGGTEESAVDTLKSFIKSETGMDNEIIRHKNWSDVVDALASKKVQLGVFQGYEFAWAQENHADLRPLALAVNRYRYATAYLMVRKDSQVKNCADLQGQSFALPAVNVGFLRLFVERQCPTQGKDLKAFFSKVSAPDNFEDALDDVVDGVVSATVADRVSLEAYKRRKPSRFDLLKEIAHSQPLPLSVVAYYDDNPDLSLRQRFQQGLVTAKQKEKGRSLLTLFRLTAFEAIPNDFDKVLAETRKAYPAPGADGGAAAKGTVGQR